MHHVRIYDLLCFCVGFPDCHETGDYPRPQGLGSGCRGTGQRDHQDDEGGHSHPAQRRSVANQNPCTARGILFNRSLNKVYLSKLVLNKAFVTEADRNF